jgi:hypothetical protein
MATHWQSDAELARPSALVEQRRALMDIGNNKLRRFFVFLCHEGFRRLGQAKCLL